MNCKTYALVSILFLSFALVGINANIKGTTYAQNNVISLKPLHKVEAGQEGISGNSKAVSGSIGENNAGSIRFISTTSASNGNNTYNVSSGSKTFPVIYQITGNGNKLKNISVAKDNTTLITNLASQSSGKLTILLPRSLIDSKKQGNQDSPYVIFEDSQPWQRVQQVKSNTQARTLSIDFDKGTGVVEIAGSVIMPANTYLNPATTTANKSTSTATTKNTNATTQSTINAVGNSTTILKFASKTFPVIYQITGNGNKLKNISVAKDNTTLITNLASQSSGKLTILLPRSLIDSKKQGNQDSPYVIFEDSQPWQRVQQVKSNTQARTLSIDFDKGTGVVEIAGSKVLPEFGTVSAVVFAIAIIGIIMASTKYKHFKFLPNH